MRNGASQPALLAMVAIAPIVVMAPTSNWNDEYWGLGYIIRLAGGLVAALPICILSLLVLKDSRWGFFSRLLAYSAASAAALLCIWALLSWSRVHQPRGFSTLVSFVAFGAVFGAVFAAIEYCLAKMIERGASVTAAYLKMAAALTLFLGCLSVANSIIATRSLETGPFAAFKDSPGNTRFAKVLNGITDNISIGTPFDQASNFLVQSGFDCTTHADQGTLAYRSREAGEPITTILQCKYYYGAYLFSRAYFIFTIMEGEKGTVADYLFLSRTGLPTNKKGIEAAKKQGPIMQPLRGRDAPI